MSYTVSVKIDSIIHILTYTVIETLDAEPVCREMSRIYSLYCTLVRDCEVIECEKAYDISRSCEKAHQMAKFLCENTVFPSQLLYVLDDILGV